MLIPRIWSDRTKLNGFELIERRLRLDIATLIALMSMRSQGFYFSFYLKDSSFCSAKHSHKVQCQSRGEKHLCWHGQCCDTSSPHCFWCSGHALLLPTEFISGTVISKNPTCGDSAGSLAHVRPSPSASLFQTIPNFSQVKVHGFP